LAKKNLWQELKRQSLHFKIAAMVSPIHTGNVPIKHTVSVSPLHTVSVSIKHTGNVSPLHTVSVSHLQAVNMKSPNILYA